MLHRRASLIILIASLLTLGTCNERQSTMVFHADDLVLPVPTGEDRPVMTDGIFQPGEWDDAATLVINDSVSVLFKQFRGHFFLALDARQLLSPSVDVFLCSDSQHITQLHVSAQLGERVLFPAPLVSSDTNWVWGRTSGWYANEFRWIYRLLDSLMNTDSMSYDSAIMIAGFPHEAIEIDLLTSKIGPSPWLFRLDIWTAYTIDRPLPFPPNTDQDDLSGWGQLVLD